MRQHWLRQGVGHYGVFNGSRFRSEIQPRIADFIAKHHAKANGGNGNGSGAAAQDKRWVAKARTRLSSTSPVILGHAKLVDGSARGRTCARGPA